jgi:hypothetical protein
MRPGQVRDGDVTPSGSRQYRFALFTASVRAIELNCPEYFGKDLVKLFRFGVKPRMVRKLDLYESAMVPP